MMQIQQLIDDVEQTKERLRGLRAELAAQQEEKEKEEEGKRREKEKEASAAQGEEEGQGRAGRRRPPPPPSRTPSLAHLVSLLAPHWRQMKMRPRFESGSTPQVYVLAARLPNMKLANLSVTLGARGESLIVKGFRGPTQEEVGSLVEAVGRSGRGGGREGVRLEDLLAAGAERFGSFVETVRVPEDADAEGVEATYEKGTLRIIIPRRPVLPPSFPPRPTPPVHPVYAPPQPALFHPSMGGYYHGGGGRRGMAPGGFWGDQDVWW